MATGMTIHEADERKPNGFFPKLYESVCQNMGNDNAERMHELKDDIPELMKFTHELDAFKNSLTVKEFYPEKNPHESKIKKEYGNKAYQDGKDLDALYLYTQAVLSAPCDEKTHQSRELSVALANRSAVLFNLKAFHLALDDIKLALESGYPNELKFKLYDRRAKCLMHFRQYADAKEAYQAAMKALDDSKLDRDRKMKFQRDVQQALDFFKKAKSVYNDLKVETHPKPDLPKLEDRNKKYPAMTSAVQFKYAPGRGRYAVASRDIDVGEVLCVEQPIVTHMLPEYMGGNCTQCFKVMKAPLPCPVCTKVMFCSYQCRKKAMSSYHPYECKYIEYLIASGMSIICFMAMRAITQKPLEFFLENKQLFKDHDETSGSEKSTITKYLSQDYRNLYNLVTHHSERKAGDIFHRAMLSLMMLKVIKRSGYFGSDVEDQILTENELFIGSLMYHFLEVLQFNAHEVAQFEMLAKNKEDGSKSVYIGAAVYPTLALFNHSCDPSLVRYYVEDIVVAQSIKIIKKGEEICENYGPIFFHSPKDDRQERLKKQYWFDCRCIPCQENWPLMHEMTGEQLNFRCHMCNGSIPFETASNNPMLRCSCGTPVSIMMALKKITESDMIHDKAKKAMEVGDLEKAQNLYAEYLTLLDEHLAPPYQDYYKIQQSIWKCIWMRHGNRVIKAKRKPVVPVSDDYDTVD